MNSANKNVNLFGKSEAWKFVRLHDESSFRASGDTTRRDMLDR